MKFRDGGRNFETRRIAGRNGARCAESTGLLAAAAPARPSVAPRHACARGMTICRYFLKGTCERGARCTFSHPGRSAAAAPPPAARPSSAEQLSAWAGAAEAQLLTLAPTSPGQRDADGTPRVG
jgi:hypothetical protein